MTAAKIIDLDSYRRARREPEVSQPMRLPMMPVCFVTYWTYVPVMVVPGFR